MGGGLTPRGVNQMKCINGNTLSNFVRLLATEGKPFYADEYNLDGAEMRSLSAYYLVKPTGNTKDTYINVGSYGFSPDDPDRYIKVKAKEWRINPDIPAWVKLEINNTIADAKAALNAAAVLGIEGSRPLPARAPVILHKRRAKNLLRFVHCAYCVFRGVVLYYNCPEGRGKTPANEDRNSPFPTRAAPRDKKF